ncbi:MAG: hypothetical protein RBS07_13795 [Lentimicrobium sp.]|jgi:hypothetical protein|nr:hypothetical protein [Lentimicrobium sp.]
MKKLPLLLVSILLVALSSCKLEGESYSHFYDKVNLETLIIQDSAFLGDTVNIYAHATAPSGCWSDIDCFFYPYNDSIYLVNAYGWYESHDGICPEILITKDSTFHFIADTTGTYVFVSESRSSMPKYDTLKIVDPR